jgi:hypothetical protein
VRAHGGVRNIERLQSFTGYGFIKDLADTVVAKSNAFDIYRSGERYKHRIIRAPGGTIGEIILLIHNDGTTIGWSARGGLQNVRAIELSVLRYRFPMILEWVQERGRSFELLPAGPADRVLRLRYTGDDKVLTIGIDRESWLLDGVEIRGVSDTTFHFAERYGVYMDLDGIPFPQRYTGMYRDRPLYEFLLSVVKIAPELPDSLFTITAADTTAGR